MLSNFGIYEANPAEAGAARFRGNGEALMRVLSIDWDYFVEEDPMLDWGHREDGIFLDMMWKIRRIDGKDMRKLAPFRGNEVELAASFFRMMLKGYDLSVAESHLAILDVIGDERDLEIINIDAHHDIFYRQPCCDLDVNSEDNIKRIDCGCWAGHLIHQGRVTSYTQVYPEWRRKLPENYNGKAKWIDSHGCKSKFVFGPPPLKWKQVDKIFVCRSGCWSPPEYDARFTRFVKLLGATKALRERECDVPDSILVLPTNALTEYDSELVHGKIRVPGEIKDCDIPF
jgi:hypothetical protein